MELGSPWSFVIHIECDQTVYVQWKVSKTRHPNYYCLSPIIRCSLLVVRLGSIYLLVKVSSMH